MKHETTERLASRLGSALVAVVVAAIALLRADIVAAQEVQLDGPLRADTEEYREPTRSTKLELVANFGVLDRATSGTGSNYRYDQNATAVGGVDVRLLFPAFDCGCDLAHGAQLGVSGSGGTALGFGDLDTSAFRHIIIDAGYIFRTELPCMASGNRRWFVTGTLGLTTLVADAGLGSGVANDVDRNVREAAAEAYDHVALGWHFGAVMDVHFGALILGFGFDLREAYGIGTELSRTFALSGSLRLGGEISL